MIKSPIRDGSSETHAIRARVTGRVPEIQTEGESIAENDRSTVGVLSLKDGGDVKSPKQIS